jgi:hypothetical protein
VSPRSGAQTVVRDLGPSLKGRASISVPVGGTALSESPTNERRGTVSQGGTCRIVQALRSKATPHHQQERDTVNKEGSLPAGG